MRVLAIDPGYERLGIAVLEKQGGKDVLVHSECFQTPKEDAHPKRLSAILIRLEEIIDEYSPNACAIETLFFAKNQTTALKVAEVRGIVLALCDKGGMDVHEFSPAAIKIGVTGYGKSDKAAVTKMIPLLVKIDRKIKHDDEFDAIAIGITCLNSRPA
jgi:crossover junction endodeoxyribonuclease RuvC